jgi:predicted DNA-binding protein (UPF0251 family)
MSALTRIDLPVEGLEAIRLADAEGLDQETAANHMGVSRPTFSRLLAEARKIVADALVNGRAIQIEGGDFEIAPSSGFGKGKMKRNRRGRKSGMQP